MTKGLPAKLATTLVVALVLPFATAQEQATNKPVAVLLEDDTDTRGDWLGVYGTYAYVLCGMRAPHNLTGGPGWPLESFSVKTGDPDEYPRAWQSSAPSISDRSVLLDPSGLKRTPATWDDHGETRPLGKGPDLHIRFAVPEGLFLAALYFFEVDWIQYREYRIRIYSDEEPRVLLIDTEVDNFLKGKYKRFAIEGPAQILIVIERGQSPNAIVSGLFLNELTPPNTHLLDRTMSLLGVTLPPVPEGPAADTLSLKAKAAADALAQVASSSAPQNTLRIYIEQEALFLKEMANFIAAQPGDYLPTMATTWRDMESRLAKGLLAKGAPEDEALLRMLMDYALYANCDFNDARQQMDTLTTLLTASGLEAQPEWPWQAETAETLATWFMFSGRRHEASSALRAFSKLCLQKLPPDKSREKLITVGRDALRAGVPLPVADCLSEWQERNGRLPGNGQSLLAGLYYAAGKNDKALVEYTRVEPDLEPGRQHRWVLIAMLTAYLREGELAKTERVLARLRSEYPASPEVDEAEYRIGVYHLEKRDLAAARRCFAELQKATVSETYRRLCTESLDRVSYLENILAPPKGRRWSWGGD